jgi:hypothetical protein
MALLEDEWLLESLSGEARLKKDEADAEEKKKFAKFLDNFLRELSVYEKSVNCSNNSYIKPSRLNYFTPSSARKKPESPADENISQVPICRYDDSKPIFSRKKKLYASVAIQTNNASN